MDIDICNGSSLWVANSILQCANKKKITVNALKLYSLMYLLYQEYLFETKTKLLAMLIKINEDLKKFFF